MHTQPVSIPPELLELIAVHRGHFELESGLHSDLWLDLDTLFAQPARLKPFVAELARKVAPYDVDAVCGPQVGGAFLAQRIADVLAVEFYYAERLVSTAEGGASTVRYQLPHGLRHRAAGKRVALVDDVISAGSALLKCAADLRAGDAVPVVALALMVLGETGAKALAGQGIPVETASQVPVHIWTEEECPLCAEDIPMDDPLEMSALAGGRRS